MSWKPPFPVVKLPDCQQNWDAIAKEVDALQADIDTLTPSDPWHDFSGVGGDSGFYNSAVNLDTGSTTPSSDPTKRDCGYRKFPDGKVKLRGQLKAALNGAIALSLPPGYRPPNTMICIGLAGAGLGYIQIQSDGYVIPVNATGGSVTSWISLDAVEFDTTP